jgi:hypothetical protein
MTGSGDPPDKYSGDEQICRVSVISCQFFAPRSQDPLYIIIELSGWYDRTIYIQAIYYETTHFFLINPVNQVPSRICTMTEWHLPPLKSPADMALTGR